MRRWFFRSLVVLTAIVGGSAVAGAETDRDTKDAARTLADEGLARYREGDFVGALERFEAAEALVKTPPITLHRARSLSRLGRYVAARRIYRSIVALDLPATAPPVHLRAKLDAQKELDQLADRISRVTVALDRALPHGAELLVDGEVVPGTSTVATVDVDPGTHRVDATFPDGRRVGSTFDVLSGESTTITLALPADALPVGSKGASSDGGPNALTTAGIVGVVVGGTLALVGVGTGIAAVVAHDDLEATCPTGTCPAASASDVDALDAMRFASTGTLIGGAAILAGGIVLVLAGSASDGDTSQPSVSLAVGPGTALLRGVFR